MHNRDSRIFVFGSNLAGMHGAGAAAHAARYHGAEKGVGEGRTGSSYAIPTKDSHVRVRSLPAIEVAVVRFLCYAQDHSELEFDVTRVGCGLAGYRDEAIAPLFRDAPSNCNLPHGWRDEYR